MEIAKLAIEFLKVIVWPSVLILFLCLFRHQISAAIGRLNSVDIAGVQAEFAELAETTREDSEQLVASQPDPPAGTAPDTGVALSTDFADYTTPAEAEEAAQAEARAAQLATSVLDQQFDGARRRAKTSPSYAVMLSWKIMEDVLHDSLTQLGYRPREEDEFPEHFTERHLRRAGLTIEGLHTRTELRALYKMAQRTPEAATPKAAEDFVESCRALTHQSLVVLANYSSGDFGYTPRSYNGGESISSP
ncbi:hypothetical protein AB0E82_32215 [Streptomyces anulatus]|uniref:hypothetical protein n=1 Tax=Streptomyces anulatus TaxID=1892 RepID=UPI0033EE31F6